MATAAALLIAALLLPRPAAAGAPETDPVRRSLVVEAVKKASPAVVNVSTEQVVEQRGSPFPFPQDPFFDEFFRDFADPRPRRFTRSSLGSGVVVLASEADGKVSLVVSVTKDLTGKVPAGQVVKQIAPIVGGGGGGRPDFAEAGGKDPGKIADLLKESRVVVERMLGTAGG